jgi:hypothetical protein
MVGQFQTPHFSQLSCYGLSASNLPHLLATMVCRRRDSLSLSYRSLFCVLDLRQRRISPSCPAVSLCGSGVPLRRKSSQEDGIVLTEFLSELRNLSHSAFRSTTVSSFNLLINLNDPKLTSPDTSSCY